MRSRKYVYALYCLLLSAVMLNGQGWERIYTQNPGADGWASFSGNVAYESDNGYIIGASLTYGEQVLLEMDWNGYILNTTNVMYAGKELQRLSDGNYVCATRVNGGSNVAAHKFDANGTIIWSQTYDNGIENDAVNDFVKNDDGDFFIVGGQVLGGGNYAYVRKIDGDGNSLWHSNMPAASGVYRIYVVPMADGGCVITGGPSYFSSGSNPVPFVARYSTTGEQLWNTTLSDVMLINGILLSSQGELLTYGIGTDNGARVVEIDVDGNELGVVSLPGVGGELQQLADGSFLMVGTTAFGVGETDVVMHKLANDYTLEWTKTYGGAYADAGRFAIATSDGGYLITGAVNGQGENAALYIVKTDEDGIAAPYLIEGNVMYDLDGDCTIESGDLPMENWVVEAEGVEQTFYGAVDGDGYYSIEVNEGSYDVSVSTENPYWEQCVSTVNVNIDAIQDSVSLDFPVNADLQCPYMHVNIQNQALRLCEESVLYIHYENTGTALAENAFVEIDLHDSLTLVSATLPYVDMGNNEYSFDIGDVDFLADGAFELVVEAGCSEELVGQSLCSEAHIYPDSTCLELNPEWSGASIAISAECTEEEVKFTIENVGTADMIQGLQYIVIQDDVIMLQEPYGPLTAGQSIEITEPADGSFYRVESPQVANHPGMSMPSAFVEACGSGEAFSLGYVNQYVLDDADAFIDLACMEIVAAYDPNEKVAYPHGYQEEHYITNGTRLEYVLHFQNTGNSFARDVILMDRLSEHLDPGTITPTVSSHEYDFELLAEGIVRFTFEDIMLPDSTTNEAGSHGYVTFSISPKEDLPLGTEINNNVDIFFDYNAAIRTNTTWHTIGENYITVDVEDKWEKQVYISAFPNPFTNYTNIKVDGIEGEKQITIFDMLGRPVASSNFSADVYRLEADNMPVGAYMFVVESNGEVIGQGKLVLH